MNKAVEKSELKNWLDQVIDDYKMTSSPFITPGLLMRKEYKFELLRVGKNVIV